MAAAVCGFQQVSEKPAAKPGAENRSLPTICNWLNVRLKIFRGFGLRSARGEVKRRRRDVWNGAGAQRRRRAADGRPPFMWLFADARS